MAIGDLVASSFSRLGVLISPKLPPAQAVVVVSATTGEPGVQDVNIVGAAGDAVGAKADAAATTDTGTFSIVALIKRGLENWTALLAKIPALVSGRIPVESVGNAAAGAADSGSPVKIGGKHNSALPTLANGQRGDLQLDPNGRALVRPMASNAVARLPSSAATTNATVAKASAGTLLSILANNTNAAIRYLKLYDKGTAPVVGTDAPLLTIALQPLTDAVIPLGAGIDFSAGISYALTTGAADADATAVGAGDIVGLNIIYS